MRGLLIFILCSFLWITSISAQEVLLDLPDSLIANLHADSLMPTMPSIDSVGQKIENSTSKLEALQDSLAVKTRILDSLSPAHIASPLLDKVDSVRAWASDLEDSLRNMAQVPDSLKKYLPQEFELLGNQSVTDVGAEKLDEIRSLGNTDRLEVPQGMNGLPDVDIGEMPTLPSLKEEMGLNELEQLSGQAEQVKGTLNAEHLEERAEQAAGQLDELQALEEQKGVLNEHTKSIEQHGDQDYYKEKVKRMAKDHFAGHTEKLHAAQEKLAKIKQDYPEGLSSIKDLPKRRPNPMKGKSFKERLLLGMTLQVHQDKVPNIDLSPFVAYKWTERLSFGLGGSYRVMTKDDFKGFTREGTVYGGRAFSEFDIHKGIFVHAGYEMMCTQKIGSLVFNGKGEHTEKTWVDGLLIGAGKDYRVARYVKGNMQVLYNFLDEISSPYQNKVMVRLGFSFQLKDKVKKPAVRYINH